MNNYKFIFNSPFIIRRKNLIEILEETQGKEDDNYDNKISSMYNNYQFEYGVDEEETKRRNIPDSCPNAHKPHKIKRRIENN